jgi:hypothetical protein
VAVASLVSVENGKKKSKWLFKIEELYKTDFEKFVVCKQMENFAVYNKIYKKELIEDNKLRFLEEISCIDVPFSARAVHYANKIVTVPNVSYFHMKQPQSAMLTEQIEKRKEDFITAKKDVLQFVREEGLQIPSNTFRYTKKSVKKFGITLYSVKENIKQEITYAFGIIPIYAKTIDLSQNST